MALEFERAYDLYELPAKRPRLQMKTQTRQLHRDRRSSAAWAGMKQTKPGANQRYGIHAGMMRKILIFVSKSCVDQLRRNITQRGPNPKFLIRGKRDSEQFAASIEIGRAHV